MKDSVNSSCTKFFIFILLLVIIPLSSSLRVSETGIDQIIYAESGDNLQQKIGECPANAGCLIILNGGIYTITDTLLINRSGVTIKGSSLGGGKYSYSNPTLIQSSGNFNNKNMINITGYRSGLEDIYINGSSTTGDGISLAGGANYLRFVHINNQGRDGIVLENNNQDSEGWIRDVWSGHNGRHGLRLSRSDETIDHYVGYRNWNGSAIYIDNSSTHSINQIHSFANNNCITLAGADKITVSGGTCAESLSHVIYFNSSASEVEQISFLGMIFHNNNINQTNFSTAAPLAETNNVNNSQVFYLDASSGNTIESVSIIGNNFDSSAYFFNQSGSDSDLVGIAFTSNNYHSRLLGNIPNNTAVLDSASGYTSIGSGINKILLYLLTERAWYFKAYNTGGSTSLALESATDGKDFQIRSPAGTILITFTPFDNAVSNKISLNALVNMTNGNFTISNHKGSGNALACFNSAGQLYRGNTTGCP